MDEQLELARDLALNTTQDVVEDFGLNLSIHFLQNSHNQEIEETRGLVLNWKDWFKNTHSSLINRFTLAVSSRGRPPVVIGASVYSYEISAKQVSIHMLEHFKRTLPDSTLNKRMGFIALTAAYVFATTVSASRLRIVNPLPGAVPYYRYLGFEFNENDMFISFRDLAGKLHEIGQNGGEHLYEWDEGDE